MREKREEKRLQVVHSEEPAVPLISDKLKLRNHLLLYFTNSKQHLGRRVKYSIIVCKKGLAKRFMNAADKGHQSHCFGLSAIRTFFIRCSRNKVKIAIT